MFSDFFGYWVITTCKLEFLTTWESLVGISISTYIYGQNLLIFFFMDMDCVVNDTLVFPKRKFSSGILRWSRIMADAFSGFATSFTKLMHRIL